MNKDNENNLGILVPIMTKPLFGCFSGLRPGQLKAQEEKRNLPLIKIGRLNLINVAALTFDSEEYGTLPLVACPAMTQEKFAQLSGLRPKQIETQINLNRIPTKHIGKLVMVDVAELTRRCLSDTFVQVA